MSLWDFLWAFESISASAFYCAGVAYIITRPREAT